MYLLELCTKIFIGATLLVVVHCASPTAERGNAKIRDSLAETICNAIKTFSKTSSIVGMLKTPHQFSDKEVQQKSHCRAACRDVRWKACSNCQKFSYTPCSNKEISSKGKPLNKKTGRIVSGREVIPNEFPFLVRFSYNKSMHFCGGSIYNENWFITAGHCVDIGGMLDDPLYAVTAGDHYRSKVEPTEQMVKIKSFVLHKGFDRFSLENDVAVVQVSPPFQFNSAVAPICLALKSDEVKLGQEVRAVGWGRIGGNNTEPSDFPKTVNIRVIKNNECRDLYVGFHNVNDWGVTCALPLTSTPAGVCRGDSGGPLVIDKGGVRLLVGLSSAARVSNCAGPKDPSVFTSIPYYYDWIVANAI